MGKYEFLYCRNCGEFSLYVSLTWDMCNTCKHLGVIKIYADSFAEMASIERFYKIKKIREKRG